MIHKSISAHFNCVLYSPVTPDAESVAPRPEDDAIAGVSTRFIRVEGRRAKKMVNTEKSNWIQLLFMSPLYRRAITVKQWVHMSAAAMTLALIECWDFVPKSTTLTVVWTREYHSALATTAQLCRFASIIAMKSKGLKNNQTKRISYGTLILFFLLFLRSNEPTEGGEEYQNDSLSDEEYDVGQPAAGTVESIVLEQTAASDNADSENVAQDPLGGEDFGYSDPETNEDNDDWPEGNEHVQHLEIERADEANASSASAAVKVELIGQEPIDDGHPFNVALMRGSLGSISNTSDCMITAEYQIKCDSEAN